MININLFKVSVRDAMKFAEENRKIKKLFICGRISIFSLIHVVKLIFYLNNNLISGESH